MSRVSWLRGERLLLLVSRLLLGGVFLAASADKILDPGPFARAVANYRILPDVAVNFFAVALVWVECVCALLLLTGQWVRSTSLVVSSLLAMFLVAVVASLARGLDISCGCFGSADGRMVGLELLVEDALWLILSLFLVLRERDGRGWRAFAGIARR